MNLDPKVGQNLPAWTLWKTVLTYLSIILDPSLPAASSAILSLLKFRSTSFLFLPHPLPPVGRPTAPSWRKTGLLAPAPTLQSAVNLPLHHSTRPISETLYFLCPDTCSKRFACHGSLCIQSSLSPCEKKAIPWEDTGSSTQLAEGNSLKDGSSVIAKIAPAHTNASVCLQREAHMYVSI